MMQTFLPYPLFSSSLDCLDDKRLGKQRVEARQIYDILTGKTQTKAWRHHPALLMWKGYEDALAVYYNMSLYYWQKRGYKNIKLKPIKISDCYGFSYPPWLGIEKFHNSHKSQLLKKNPVHYGYFKHCVTEDIPYYWPTKEGLM